jgi:hypothetical protein
MRYKADAFIKEVKAYFQVNQDIAGFNSPIQKVAITLILIKGPDVKGWVCDMETWIDRLNPITDNIPDVWDQFIHEFRNQFQDSNKQ